MVRYQITLDSKEADLLLEWAKSEFRDPREQIRFLLRKELEHHGLLIASSEDTLNESEVKENE